MSKKPYCYLWCLGTDPTNKVALRWWLSGQRGQLRTPVIRVRFHFNRRNINLHEKKLTKKSEYWQLRRRRRHVSGELRLRWGSSRSWLLRPSQPIQPEQPGPVVQGKAGSAVLHLQRIVQEHQRHFPYRVWKQLALWGAGGCSFIIIALIGLYLPMGS